MISGNPLQPGGVRSANGLLSKLTMTPTAPAPPPLGQPGESFQASATQAAPPPNVVTTRSGVTAEMRTGQLGLGVLATLPAGALLPSSVVIDTFASPEGPQVKAHLDNADKTPVSANFTNDGRVCVTLENSPTAPLLMFNPENLDYGLSSRNKTEEGQVRRSLDEVVHADGSRSLYQDIKYGQDGSTSYNFVREGADGDLSASSVVQDRTGKTIKNSALTVSKGDEGQISLGGSPIKEMMDKASPYLEKARGWASQDKLLGWMFQKSTTAPPQQTPAPTTTNFATFSSTMAKFPQRLFPTLASPPPPEPQTLQGTGAASAVAAGVAAMLTSINPNLSPADIKEIMTSTAKDGVLDANAAIAEAQRRAAQS